ncbi:MAG TPA: hypothetical protein VFC75_00670 [Erysipelothrix sp.]|nr:hypothetical protein [Erysipelothrix sp.]
MELTSTEIHKIIKDIYSPKDVINNSDMDGGDYQYLVALNNKGYNAHEIKLSDKVTMNTLDKAIRYKHLYYLEITIEDKCIAYSFWKYPRKTSGQTLITSIKPFKKRHIQFIKKLDVLSNTLNYKLKDPLY